MTIPRGQKILVVVPKNSPPSKTVAVKIEKTILKKSSFTTVLKTGSVKRLIEIEVIKKPAPFIRYGAYSIGNLLVRYAIALVKKRKYESPRLPWVNGINTRRQLSTCNC